jgi:hypothetical protein
MKIRNRVMLVSVALFVLVSTGCESLTDPDDDVDEGQLKSEIEAFITEEDSLFSMNDFEDDEEQNLLKSTVDGLGKSNTLRPRRVRRSVDQLSREHTITVIEEDSALINFTHTISGSIRVAIDTSDPGDLVPDTVWIKPYEVTTQQNVIVVKKPYPEEMSARLREHLSQRHNGWRLHGMSPVIGTTTGTDLTVEYLEIRNVTKDDTLRLEDPLNTFITREERPYFVVSDSVELELKLANADDSGERVVAQYRPWWMRLKKIVRLNDQEISPDVLADDDIYTGGWNLYLRSGLRKVTVDVIDEDLLTVPEADYNAIFWRVPYYVFPFLPE